MNSRLIIRMVIDVLMTILYLCLMGYLLTGNKLHEILGITLFILFVVHNVLNVRWYKVIFKGQYPPRRILLTAINLLLLLMMLGMLISALMISQYVFALIHFGSHDLGRKIHSICAYSGLILMGMHIGLHWTLIMGSIRDAIKITDENLFRRVVLRCIAFFIAGYGIYAFYIREVWQKLTLENLYPLWLDGDTLIYCIIDFFFILGLFALLTYYGAKLLKNTKD